MRILLPIILMFFLGWYWMNSHPWGSTHKGASPSAVVDAAIAQLGTGKGVAAAYIAPPAHIHNGGETPTSIATTSEPKYAAIRDSSGKVVLVLESAGFHKYYTDAGGVRHE